jgi:hypothetical protein
MNKLKFLFVMVLALSVFSRCSSDAPVLASVEPEAKLYDVMFTVDDFTTDIGTRNTTKRNLAYWVFDGNIITTEGKIAAADRTNQLKLKLPKGDYQIAVVSSDDDIRFLFKEPGNSSFLTLQNACVFYSNLKSEIFTRTMDFKVEDQPVQETIELIRPISKVSLRIDDLNKIPASVNKIVPVFYASGMGVVDILSPYAVFLDNGKSIFTKHTFYGSEFSSQLDAISISKDQFHLYNKENPISFYFPQTTNFSLLDSDEERQVDLYLVGTKDTVIGMSPLLLDSENVLFSKLLRKNIQLKSNQSVTISGSVVESDGLKLDINDQWGETTNIDF